MAAGLILPSIPTSTGDRVRAALEPSRAPRTMDSGTTATLIRAAESSCRDSAVGLPVRKGTAGAPMAGQSGSTMVAGLISQSRVAGVAGTGTMIEIEIGTEIGTETDSGTGTTTREGKTR